MAARNKAAGPTPVTATHHSDTRVNIPTSELSDFFADDEQQPGQALYPRDPTLDPQLVWKGKDEQDLAEYLRVASVPGYIQEKVDPRALVENLRQTAAAGRTSRRHCHRQANEAVERLGGLVRSTANPSGKRSKTSWR